MSFNSRSALVQHLLEDDAPDRYVGIVVLREREGGDGMESLVIKRAGPPEEGKWACPGGHVEKGESDKKAAFRELEEETGISADEMHKFDEEEVDIGHLSFWWTLVPGKTKAKAADDAEKAKWVPVDDPPELAWDNAEKIQEACRLSKR